MRRIRVIVSGRVQGVSYRASTAQQAAQLGLVGWVRNLDDGTVELEAEGEDAQIAALIAWCHDGPRHAVVSRVAVEEQTPTKTDQAFRIA